MQAAYKAMISAGVASMRAQEGERLEDFEKIYEAEAYANVGLTPEMARDLLHTVSVYIVICRRHLLPTLAGSASGAATINMTAAIEGDRVLRLTFGMMNQYVRHCIFGFALTPTAVLSA